MTMHNPPHPGEFIIEVYLEPNGISGREVAEKLDVAPSTLSRVLKGSSRITPEMALRLSKSLGRSPERAGSRCKTPTIFGWRGRALTWIGLESSNWQRPEPVLNRPSSSVSVPTRQAKNRTPSSFAQFPLLRP